eukprot:44789-Amphidinium_carterae.1
MHTVFKGRMFLTVWSETTRADHTYTCIHSSVSHEHTRGVFTAIETQFTCITPCWGNGCAMEVQLKRTQPIHSETLRRALVETSKKRGRQHEDLSHL